MHKITIEILLENEAFGDAPMTELARILREYAARIEEYGPDDCDRLRDHNGNTCGTARISQ